MDWWFSPDNWLALGALTALETVLGVDNLIFLALALGRLPAGERQAARIYGLVLAMIARLALLFSVFAMTRLTAPLFAVLGRQIALRNLVLAAGGLFLMLKGVAEVHGLLEGTGAAGRSAIAPRRARAATVIAQIALVDILFSLDSVFTAIGLARPDQWPVMATAIVISVLLMIGISGAIAGFVERHPTVKVLALAFLVLIGAALVADGIDVSVPKGYLYSAMAFAFAVELINIRLRQRAVRVDAGDRPGPG